MTLIESCRELRGKLLALEGQARTLKVAPDLPSAADPSEAAANIMLAVRHMEDARMRLGKVIQHAEGGGSRYDR